MTLRRAFAAILAVVAAAAPVLAGPKIGFDQGIDVKEVLSDIKESPKPVAQTHDWQGRPLYRRSERDCANISFSPDDPLRSERVELESREYEERCHPSGPHGDRRCHDEWVRTERRNVRVEISGRGAMLPWERDVFEVCLDGQWLSARVIDASHQYFIQNPGWSGDTIEARAGGKTRSMPDPGGISARFGLDPETKNFVMDLTDRWASYYKGEATVLNVILKRHHRNWFDDTVLDKEISLPAGESASVRFADFASEFSRALVPGKNYYVKWRFKRSGQVSKDKWVDYRETDKAGFGAAAAAENLALSSPGGFASITTCRLDRFEARDCVYKCSDGSERRRPIAEPDPLRPDAPVIACPQILIPFGAIGGR